MFYSLALVHDFSAPLLFSPPPTRALVDILRSQASPVQQGERNDSSVLTNTTVGDGLGRPPKNLYTPVLQSKDNRSE